MLYECEPESNVHLIGDLEVIDEEGNVVEDCDVADAARTVYDLATDMINGLLIPGLNDILYGERKFPLENQEVYEKHGYEMMRAAYKVVAYSGAGKVKGQDLLVYPIDPMEYQNGYFGLGRFTMRVRIEEL